MTTEQPYRPEIQQKMPTWLRIFLSVIGVAIFLASSWWIARQATTSKSIQQRLGAQEIFTAGDARTLSERIATQGPVLYPDLLKTEKGTPIFVQHLGSDPAKNWYSFAAREINSATNCYVDWVSATRQFKDRCSKKLYPENGTGLQQFAVKIEDSRVKVGLK